MERRVLVVEDDPHVLRLLTDLLKADQYDVITAMDGEAGLRCVSPRRNRCGGHRCQNAENGRHRNDESHQSA